MSQRLPASRPASHSPPAPPQKITLPPVQLRDDIQHGGREGGRQLPEMEGRGLPQPSPQFPHSGQTTPSGEGWRAPPLTSRDLGVHSMLNPSEPEGSGSIDRHSRGPPSQSPSFAPRQSPQFGNSPTTAPLHTFSTQQPTSGAPPMVESFGGTLPRARRILTPRSPSRVFSASRGGHSHNIDASRSPFLTGRGRAYTTEQHGYMDAPSMTTPPVLQGHHPQHYGFPPASAPLAPRRASGGSMQAPGQMPPSQSASPSMSTSSQNPSNQTSPASFPYKGPQVLQSAAPYFPGSSFGSVIQQGGGSQFQEVPTAPEGPYSTQAPSYAQGDSSLHSSSASSSRQTSASDPIQVMTITTLAGEFTVPVDVHQASKIADEKRKRNAGASARFRQRRKDKEKDANAVIDKLKQQANDLERRVREMEGERDFYRSERNRFREVVYRTPEIRHLAQGPPSPHTSSLQSTSFPPQQAGTPVPLEYHSGPTSPEERAPRRRRTDARGDFASVPYSAPPPSSLPPVQSTASNIARAPGPNLPPIRMESPALPRTSGGAIPSTEAPPPQYPPFQRGPYERGWPPGEGERR